MCREKKEINFKQIEKEKGKHKTHKEKCLILKEEKKKMRNEK